MRADKRGQRSQETKDFSSSTLSPLYRAVAILFATGAVTSAHAAPINLAGVAAQVNAARNQAVANGLPALGVSPQQALNASLPSIQNLAHTAQTLTAQIAAQQAAAKAAANTTSSVPNGLTPGGLQVAPGATSDPNNPVLWVNANLPTQSNNADGSITVDVKQNAQNAVLTWQTMNVGARTTLNFDQSGGTQTNGANNWVVLNRIQDPSGAPSQILGHITAQGSVYVINRNGILFGAGSQINVHSLVASSLDLLNSTDDLVQTPTEIATSNQQFLALQGGAAGGLAPLEAGQNGGSGQQTPNEVLGLGNVVSVSSPSDYVAPGAIVVSPGAMITTHTNGSASDGGLVLLAAPTLTNGGAITADDGQIILAAGVGLGFIANPSNPQVLNPIVTGALHFGAGLNPEDVTPVGVLTNTGIVQSARGNIDMLGAMVNQDGAVAVTTSVNVPGTIQISAEDEFAANTPTGGAYPGFQNPEGINPNPLRAGTVVLGDGAVAAALPDTDGATATSTPGVTFTAGSVNLKGGSVWLQGGSLVEAPGSSVDVVALTPSSGGFRNVPGDTSVLGRVYIDAGATIDVSGLANVELPISATLLTVPLVGQNELANSPLLRNGVLFDMANVVVDSTLSGTNPDGSQWVGSPILNLAGAVALMPRTVDQLLINGGSIALAGNEVITAAGSSLNLNGGYIHYLGGMVDTTRLIDSSGAIVPIGSASPYDKYVGVAGEFVESHPRWNISTTWFNPMIAGGSFEGDFIVGGNAGTLSVYATSAMVLDGNITAQAFGGSKQTQGNTLPSGGTFNLGTEVALTEPAGSFSDVTGDLRTIILQGSAPDLDTLSPGFSESTPFDTAALGALSSTDPENVLATTAVPVNTLTNGGFSNVNIQGDKQQGKSIIVAAGSILDVQAGGSITLNAPAASITVDGSLIAPSGKISLSSNGDITVGSSGVLSAAGQWINNDTTTATGTTQGSTEYINGGSVSLSASSLSQGSILLEPGSVIDVSSGGAILSNGQFLMQNGIPDGKGGSVSLIVYNGPYNGTGDPLPSDMPTQGHIQMDGTIDSLGFSGGGTLTLQALGIQIGGDPSAAPSWALALPADFFAHQGFGSYLLNAMYDATVEPGTIVALTQQNLIANVPALQQTVSGSDIHTGSLTSTGTIDAYDRQPTDLLLTAGGYLDWKALANSEPPFYAPQGVTGAVTIGEGASITGDAKASISLASPAQVTVLGSLIAPGGAITLSANSNGASTLPGQPPLAPTTSDSKSVWLGQNAVLDVSGVALTNPMAAPVRMGLQEVVPNEGTVLPGGSVTISDDSGFIVAQAGSRIDVSGTSAVFDEPASQVGYAPQQVWSDAGSITINASSGLAFDATLVAHGGAPQATGGTLSLTAINAPISGAYDMGASTVTTAATTNLPGATAIILQQSGDLATNDVFGQSLGAQSGVLLFSADRLGGSGISTFIVGSSNPLNPFAPIAFAGNVNLSLADAVMLETPRIVQLPAGATTLPTQANGIVSIGSPVVSINAPYVEIGPVVSIDTWTPIRPVSAGGDGTLNINASFVDILNQTELDQVGQFNVTSATDIRLTSTLPNPDGSNSLVPGELFTSGNVTFTAHDIYPSTGSEFILDAVGATDPTTQTTVPTTVTFRSNGVSGAPLSAGGALLVDATNIDQGGTVRAPSGTLILGVGDPTSTDTIKQFDSLPIVATQNVIVENGSITSVSNDGAIIPYGTTVDGVEWQFNPVPGVNAAPDLTAPPAKYVGLNGASVALQSGATIDLSGGGDLQAAEWVPGTGGTRNLLSQYNVSFATTAVGVAVPVSVGATNVYAIVPGAQSPVAAYDPTFAQSIQPTGASGTTTVSAGVGAAALNGVVGQSVYLSGVPGLAPGVYTLLPAQYATLPGAYRVTLSSAPGAAPVGATQVLPDGTVVASGYLTNSLTGSRSATPVLFDVQSSSVWQQYSQYTLTSANSFFSSLAVTNGTIAPMLPQDGGQLVLSASQALSLGAKLNAAAAPGGAPAEVDIASQDIQIVGSGEAALPGYLQINVGDLDTLGAGSLLIGGTRTLTSTGFTIDPESNSVVVSTDAANPLTGPEIILVTKTDTTGTDPNAANGLRVDNGSVISAQGAYPAAKDVPITVGTATSSGDGALLSVSNGAPSVVTRLDTTGTGLLTVGDNATLAGGQALTLDSSGNLTFSPTASLSGNTIAVDGSLITFVSDPAAASNLTGFVVGPTQIAQLGAANNVILRSAGAMNFDGNLDIAFSRSVELSAGTFNGDGGNVTISAPQIALTNAVGATAVASTSGTGSLTIDGSEIDLGAGDRSTTGFGSVAFNATGGIVAQGSGSFDIGATSVALTAPVIVADTGSNQAVSTVGTLDLDGASGTALQRVMVGGAWSFTGGTVNVNGTVSAPAGNVTIEATGGDLTVANGAVIDTTAVPLQFFDETLYGPAGAISLTSDVGNVVVAQGSTLNFAGASGGGSAGSLNVSAPEQAVQLDGTILGSAAQGYSGGSFSLVSGSAVDLDQLATSLASSGINNSISIQSNTGNLLLSAGSTLTAHTVSLIADGGTPGPDSSNGAVEILGTINASGNAGGEIDLYGKTLVDVEGTLLAVAGTPGATPLGDVITPNERGGTINLGTAGTPNTVGGVIQVDPTYGYESVSSANSGTIVVGANALIDVSGGTLGGVSGGAVNFRLPLLAGGTSVNLDLPAGFNTNKGIYGSTSTQVEAYAVWSTIDPTTGAQHFDGIVDPAGWFQDATSGGGTPAMVAGTWTDQTGSALPAPTTPDEYADYLANDIFTPGAGDVNADHASFYGYLTGSASAPGTLMSFVEQGLTNLTVNNASSVTGLQVVPGIELDNPSSAINNGNISVLTNWNLGAGTSESDLAFRFDGTIAPIITFRAENELDVKASLTDGFFQIANPIPVVLPGFDTAEAAYTTKSYGYAVQYYGAASHFGVFTSGPATTDQLGGTTEQQDAYYALYIAYAKFLDSAAPPSWIQYQGRSESMLLAMTGLIGRYGRYGDSVGNNGIVAPTPPSASDEQSGPSAYTTYLQEYGTFLGQATDFLLGNLANYVNAALPVPVLAPPIVQLDTPSAGGGGGGTDNTPSPVATQGNRLALAAASVMRGNSTTFRLVSGANLSSSDPLSVQSVSNFSGQDNGSVVLDGHTSYVDSANKQILVPTMIRTGNGAIEIASANNLELDDPQSYTAPQDYDLIPGVIYTAGTPVTGAPSSDAGSILLGGQGLPGFVSGLVANTQGGGDVTIRVQRDIQGGEDAIDQTGAVTGVKQGNLAQFWWQWMELANPNTNGTVTQTTIDFSDFDQGIMSVGGNVDIRAGGNISDLGVSLPTTWYQDTNGNIVTVGGGNLSVTAGGNIASGSYFVANGTGTLTAGGAVTSDGLTYVATSGAGNQSINQSLGTLLATQSGTLSVSAVQGVQVAGVFDPSYLNFSALKLVYGETPDAQGYSSASSVSIATTTGDINFGGMTSNALTLIGAGNNDMSYVLPASVNLTALTGGIDVGSGGALYPSATGNLNLIAAQTINIASQGGTAYADLTMLDIDASEMASPTQQNLSVVLTSQDDKALNHTPAPLHADDPDPVRIYSLDGSIIDGSVIPAGTANAGAYENYVGIVVGKPALVEAGQDIVNLAFEGQNLNDSDVTRIVAGRDILDTPYKMFAAASAQVVVPGIVLGGPGVLDVEAGRNIGPLTNPAQVFAVSGSGFPDGTLEGIETIGNADNPFLPHQSATVQVMFGIGPGADDAAFIANYINPATSLSDVASSAPALVQFVEGFEGEPTGTLSAQQAFAQFQSMPSYLQQLFIDHELFNILSEVGTDFNDPNSMYRGQYARGYAAINTLFPASLGYTANSLGGGVNGASSSVTTGNLDLRGTTIQTQQGGDVMIVGPGGQALVGSSSAPPDVVGSQGQVIAGPGTAGILTLEQGDVDIFTDQSLLLAQSRVFTEQGGSMTIWSSNGNIDAGKGATTSADVPRPIYVCDVNHYCTLDARGEVTGAGIATLQTIPGAPPGDVNLVAPRGTVDAGAAGIRVSGNFNVAALEVVNAANIQVKGTSIGVPGVATVNVAAVTAGTAAASAVTLIAKDAADRANRLNGRQWLVTVEVTGFGKCKPGDRDCKK